MFTYAEQFKCQPHEVESVPLKWWLRWLYWEQAKTSHRAWEHSRQSGDWVKDLSPAEQRAMSWALDKSNG